MSRFYNCYVVIHYINIAGIFKDDGPVAVFDNEEEADNFAQELNSNIYLSPDSEKYEVEKVYDV